MRITVYDVLSYLASGMTHQEILADLPYLTEEDILACLSYAADRERQQLVVKGGSSSSIKTFRRDSSSASPTSTQAPPTFTL
jgi:hypothetical protein